MTTTDINAINRTLAKFMGWRPEIQDGDVHGARTPQGKFMVCSPELSRFDNFWSPATDRNDLAEVAAKLTPEQWAAAKPSILRNFRESEVDQQRWLLTCDPAIPAKVLAEIVNTPAR